MNRLQKFITSVVPQSWAASMEADSRAWKISCTCGFERSIWESGGIRWSAKGSPKTWGRCPNCNQMTWLSIEYRPDGAAKG